MPVSLNGHQTTDTIFRVIVVTPMGLQAISFGHEMPSRSPSWKSIERVGDPQHAVVAVPIDVQVSRLSDGQRV